MATGDKLVTLDELKLVNDRIKVTGVKGNAESTYRTGDVNLTPANIGAVSKGGDTMTWGLTLPFIELKPDTSSSHGGYIDFHFAGTTADYTVRLIESAEGILSIRPATDNAYYPIITTKDVIEKALYNTNTNGLAAYPTEPGLYRVTQFVTGLPSGLNNYYGVLMIYGAGSYYNHVYIDSNLNQYFAYKASTGAPASWKKAVRSDETIAVDHGGTGATTAAAARTNLGITPVNIGALPVNPRSIELYPPTTATDGGFIDFHHAGSTADYTSRIMETASGVLSIERNGDGNTRRQIATGGKEISSNLQIAASISVDLSDYTRIECDWQCPGGRIHLSMPEKGVWYAASALSENVATATNYNIYGIKIKFTDSGFEVSYCGYKIMNTGAWTDRLGNNGYTLRRVYGYTWN